MLLIPWMWLTLPGRRDLPPLYCYAAISLPKPSPAGLFLSYSFRRQVAERRRVTLHPPV